MEKKKKPTDKLAATKLKNVLLNTQTTGYSTKELSVAKISPSETQINIKKISKIQASGHVLYQDSLHWTSFLSFLLTQQTALQLQLNAAATSHHHQGALKIGIFVLCLQATCQTKVLISLNKL